MGIERLSIFGSTARGEARDDSDVDLAAELDRTRRIGLFQFATMADHLEALLDVRVDLLCEPTGKPRLQQQIDQDRVLVF